ncbi:hypothetical protein [Pelobacter propionicus]|uniref:Capsule polysaccharide biosynthesis n=1 Tax=Pelobacter propionicus (strain DSM 2379 / NBRC 103807 / OttBd1) TaxID=338966 RepID=A1ASP5_PELPD|nr:hypothetical protein [Pelobacter propionicus]ABL00366.1 hypothetical protein Ppro_2766 [Pelobacter propionicus DSM 2379]
MRFFSAFLRALGDNIPRIRGVPRLETIDFSRLPKVSKGLVPTYYLSRGAFFRHLLYSSIFHTVKHHSKLFEDTASVILQWGDYRLPRDMSRRRGLFSVAKLSRETVDVKLESDALKSSDGKEISGRKVIYAEHGWLPRSTYQLSSQGCNCRSHVTFESSKEYVRLVGGFEKLKRLKRNLVAGFGDVPVIHAHYVEQPFFLVAQQPKTGNDLVFLKSGASLGGSIQQGKFSTQLGQALIDYVESVPSSCRIIFAQHPGDFHRNRYRVNSCNTMIYAGHGPRTIDLVRHVNCRGVIAINSNILHEALLWQRPVLALGEMQAGPAVESPFSGKLQDFLRAGGKQSNCAELRDQYLAMLFAYQWTLSDLQEPLILREILRDVDGLVPCTVRREYGSCL